MVENGFYYCFGGYMTLQTYLVRKNQVNDFNTLWQHLGFQNETQKVNFNLASLYEEDDRYVLEVNVPGFNQEELAIHFEDGVMTLTGEKKEEANYEGRKYHFNEKSTVNFRRSFRLGEDVAEDNISAQLKDGILKITMTKSPVKKPKTIQIQKLE